jgi:hypothetical protein
VHADDALVQVDVGAAQAQGLVLPESEREPGRPLGAVPACRSQLQQRARLGKCRDNRALIVYQDRLSTLLLEERL